MPRRRTLYKGLITLVAFLTAAEYFLGIIEIWKWESVFTFNKSRFVKVDNNIEEIHSPLMMSMISTAKKNLPNRSSEEKSIVKESRHVFVRSNVTATNAGVIALNSSEVEASMRTSNSTDTPLCHDIMPVLDSSVKVIESPTPSIVELERRFSWLEPGGHWYPTTCRALKKVALIIPYRNRVKHVLLFLQHMHPFLKKQQIDYTIYIIEQEGVSRGAFNKGILMNAGFLEALKQNDYDCFIFHDIDLLPEDERNLYTCPEQPRHMSVAIDKFNYELTYDKLFGGVVAITREHFLLLNGFSTSFWGWGGEDDDMSNRITYHNLFISRYPSIIARYTMLRHKKEKPSPRGLNTLWLGQQKFDTDGLSSLKYSLKQLKKNLLYTWMLVDVQPLVWWQLAS